MMDKGKGREIILKMIEKTKEKDVYLTTGKYAKKYGVTAATVRSWIRKGKLEYHTISGRGKGDAEFRVRDKKPVEQVPI